jgi:CDP-diacylglycerol pyrophosphatase
MRLLYGALLGLALTHGAARAADPSALWKIVNGECVPHEETEQNPAPCAAVDLAEGVQKGYGVLKDINGVAQFLLIPTARIGGIEDPAILAPGATNYWAAAWKARSFVDQRLHTSLPRDAIALAINSLAGRTQNQLHIHIDCVRPDVRRALAENLDKIAEVWTQFPVLLAGHAYRSIRINQENLDGVDPFHLLANDIPHSQADMGMHTLVLVGTSFADGSSGFVLLDDHADIAAGDRASGEQLQDHTCAIAQK